MSGYVTGVDWQLGTVVNPKNSDRTRNQAEQDEGFPGLRRRFRNFRREAVVIARDSVGAVHSPERIDKIASNGQAVFEY